MASLLQEPTTSDSYTPLGSTEIRLVEILPGQFDDPIEIKIAIVDLKDNPTYDALSYVWKPRDGTVDTSQPLDHAFVLNHSSFSIKIGANLEAAIRHLRPETSGPVESRSGRVMWIDAICINQDLSWERNHQVRLMKQIYSSAQHVVVWLGPSHKDSDFIIRTLRTGSLAPSEQDRFKDGLEFLLWRDWFSRVWVRQPSTRCLTFLRWPNYNASCRAFHHIMNNANDL
jgi:hypothetical protein